MVETWKLCSSCKKPIAFEQKYYVCSVSTCNRLRTGMYFCTVPCFEAHLPMMRHRDAWAEEATAPTRAKWEAEQRDAEQREAEGAEAKEKPVMTRRIVPSAASSSSADNSPTDDEILVVISKLKKYIKDRSGMNASDAIAVVLSNQLCRMCNGAIERAGRDGRKTVLDRDFRFSSE
jgi:hypothetical protein